MHSDWLHSDHDRARVAAAQKSLEQRAEVNGRATEPTLRRRDQQQKDLAVVRQSAVREAKHDQRQLAGRHRADQSAEPD